MADTKETKKTAEKKSNGHAETIATAAAAAAKPAPILTPSQAIGIFTENLPKEQAQLVKADYDKLLTEFANESGSRITIGKLLREVQETLGENFSKFLDDCIVKVLRKSRATCYSYMALASLATLKFAKNKVVSTALFRIWGAEGSFDSVNGELKPVVDQAIGACGGIPESTDSATCEQWVRKFVDTVDQMVRGGRQAQPGGKRWDAETITTKSAQVVKAYRTFITNQSVSAKKASALLTAILVESMVEMSASEVRTALDAAVKQVSERKADIKEHADNTAAAAA
jgi:hypothetical protein